MGSQPVHLNPVIATLHVTRFALHPDVPQHPSKAQGRPWSLTWCLLWRPPPPAGHHHAKEEAPSPPFSFLFFSVVDWLGWLARQAQSRSERGGIYHNTDRRGGWDFSFFLKRGLFLGSGAPLVTISAWPPMPVSLREIN